jgi:hypothetical protein
MTPQELKAVIDANAAADQTFAALVAWDTFDANAAAAALSAGRTKIVSHMITERGVIAALGVVDGEAFLEGLEAFSAATLPDGHPLKAAHPGIKRMLGWLKTDGGLDVGDIQAHTLLDTLAAVGVVQADDVASIKALTIKPDPVNAYEVVEAMRG